MKSLGFIFGAVLSLSAINAQTLNEKGLYIDNNNDNTLFNGTLFNGIVSKTQEGVRSEFSVKEGVITGSANYYYASGKLMESGFFTDGKKDQKWTRFNESGSISAIAFYALGKKTGTWLVFDDNNKKRFEMNYENGEKIGVWTSWDENGAIASSKNFGQVN